MVEGVSPGSYPFANLIVFRQVPGLQPKMSKRNKQGISNLENRTRPDFVERILAQRARHSNINANNQELEQRSRKDCSEGAMGEEELDAEEEIDQAHRHEAEMKELADQQGETPHSRSLHLSNLTNLSPSQPATAAKTHVSFAYHILILLITLHQATTSGSNSGPTEHDENSDPPKKRQRVATTGKAKGKRGVAARKGKKRI